MRTTRRAAERNYGLYGGMWGRVGPSRSQEEAEILREELRARAEEEEKRKQQRNRRNDGHR